MVADLLLQVSAGERIAALLGSTTTLVCAGIVAIVQIIAWWRLFDKVTTVEWGEAVFKTLTNATIPRNAHGATRLPKCAKDVTAAYFTYPDATPNLSCVEAMRPVFVLPDNELPE